MVARRTWSHNPTHSISGEKQHGRHSLARTGDSLSPAVSGQRSNPRLHHRRCSRQGKAYAAIAALNRTFRGSDQRSIRTLRHWRMSATRGNGRCLRSCRVKAKYPRATPLAIAGKLFALNQLSGLSRGTTRRYDLAVASRIHDEPTRLSRVGCIRCPNWKVVVIASSSA